jgi:hypothetical protein
LGGCGFPSLHQLHIRTVKISSMQRLIHTVLAFSRISREFIVA